MFNLTVNAQVRDWKDLPGCLVNGGIPTLKCLEVVAGNVLFAASTLIIVLLLVMFIVGAFNYLTSLGNPERVKKAQATLRYALVGFSLFLVSFLILKIIDVLFLGDKGLILRFEIP